mgnify:CR=1 FL=1
MSMKASDFTSEWRTLPPSVLAYLFIKMVSDDNPLETLGLKEDETEEIIEFLANGWFDE